MATKGESRMEWQQMLDTLAALPPAEQRSWWLAGLGVLVAMGLAFALEALFFRRSRRVGSWGAVRAVSLLSAPLAVLAVVGPARSVSGMEALAVFYLCLFTVGPLIWFGSHWLVGRSARPALTGSECTGLALSGMAIFALPGVAFFMAESPLREAARSVDERHLPSSGAGPIVYAAQPLQRFVLPVAGRVYVQSLVAPPGIRLQAVEQRRGGVWPVESASFQPDFCVEGDNVHLMWSAREPAPYLRLRWLEPNGRQAQGEFTPDLAEQAAGPQDTMFSVAVRPEGVDPVVPIPRQRAWLQLARPDGSGHTVLLAQWETGEDRRSTCISRGYRRPRWQTEGAIQALNVQFRIGGAGAPLIATFTAEGGSAPAATAR
ncbi:MAG: hypothetical protein KF686_09935 [Ramlibacter sp.]|nr:hypothetical protein [Ramlibacter sp.]